MNSNSLVSISMVLIGEGVREGLDLLAVLRDGMFLILVVNPLVEHAAAHRIGLTMTRDTQM